ncbi:MAG: hypothetical protein EOP56_01030 [Sphingobacteriales bacterium]|nr:MAG: hypothetical protein EOP56_01030 [Sphingobacteriales bacterium]
MNRFTKYALTLAITAGCVACKAQELQTSFYVLGQPNQFQLFMSGDAGNDIYATRDMKNRVVFIHLTSGDGSCSPGAILNTPYYEAREAGTRKAIQLMATYEHTPGGQDWPLWFDVWEHRANTENLSFNGHSIQRKQYKNVYCYYLRLPDGCGSKGLHGESMAYLRDGHISSVTAIDGSTTYHSWADLTGTLNAIMNYEISKCSDTAKAWLHVADTDTSINPGDHADNIAAAQAGMEAFSTVAQKHAVHMHQEFSTAALPENEPADQIAKRAAMYAAADYAATSLSEPSRWSSADLIFLSRAYARTVFYHNK